MASFLENKSDRSKKRGSCHIPNSAFRSEGVKACLTMEPSPSTSPDESVPSCGHQHPASNHMNVITQSLVVLSSVAVRRRHPELRPVLPPERDTSLSSSRVNNSASSDMVRSTGPKRAISMTRLDQLARPRLRTARDDGVTSFGHQHATSNHMNVMTQSLVVLPSAAVRRRHPELRPVLPPQRDTSLSSSRVNNSASSDTVRSTGPKRAISMTRLDQLARPRQRAARPISIAGTMPDMKSTFARQSRDVDRRPATSASMRPNRAPSAGSSSRKPITGTETDSKTTVPKPPPPRKPAHVKAAAAARKTVKQQAPTDTKQVEKAKTPKTETPSPVTFSPSSSTATTPVPECVPEPDIAKKNEQEIVKRNEEEIVKKKEKEVVQVKEKPEKVEATPKPEKVEPTTKPEVCSIVIETQNGAEKSEAEKNVEDTERTEAEAEEKKRKDLTEDEYKKILAERRKLAREQAEREAEIQRQKEEQLRLEEEERQRKLEEEERLFEEEQIRLAEEHRRIQEEKLQKAIEEQQQREEEERRQREEEARARQEKEEQELKAREEAERARLELEERLRKDEEERLARKKRVEAIMSRTRKTPGKEMSPNSEGSRTPEIQQSDSSNVSPVRTREDVKNLQNLLLNSSSRDLINKHNNQGNVNANGTSLDSSQADRRENNREPVNGSRLNGKGSSLHELSPVERLEAAVGNLLDFNSLSSEASEVVQPSSTSPSM